MNQRQYLSDALRAKDYSQPLNKKDYAAHSKVFKSDLFKAKLRAEWEKHMNEPWPTYKQDVYSKTKKAPDGSFAIIKRKGQNYDMHHIIEKKRGGPHEWWNVHPASVEQHQSGINTKAGVAKKLSFELMNRGV